MLKFINAAWTQFHAVEEAFQAAGSCRISEALRDAAVGAGKGRALLLHAQPSPPLWHLLLGLSTKRETASHMVGAHTDSPCLKLKPVSKGNKPGYPVGECGAIWGEASGNTWFDP
eukprot:jgi/Botrbrau1/4966/Bobra.0122s0041.1